MRLCMDSSHDTDVMFKFQSILNFGKKLQNQSVINACETLHLSLSLINYDHIIYRYLFAFMTSRFPVFFKLT